MKTQHEQELDAEANEFAMELLMPRDWVMKDYRANKHMDTESLVELLAKRYAVTPVLMTIRLSRLGVFDPPKRKRGRTPG